MFTKIALSNQKKCKTLNTQLNTVNAKSVSTTNSKNKIPKKIETNSKIINPFYKPWDECSCEDAVGSIQGFDVFLRINISLFFEQS